MRYGALKKGSPRLTAQLEAVLDALEILPFDSPADSAYGLIRTRLEQAGQLIGGNDLLIAAQALAFGYTIVTDNQRKFARVTGWLAKTGCAELFDPASPTPHFLPSVQLIRGRPAYR